MKTSQFKKLLEQKTIKSGQVFINPFDKKAVAASIPFSGIDYNSKTETVVLFYDPYENMAEITPHFILKLINILYISTDEIEEEESFKMYGNRHLLITLEDYTTLLICFSADEENKNMEEK